jgi:hypothetical protein
MKDNTLILKVRDVRELYKLYIRASPNSFSFGVKWFFNMISELYWSSGHEFKSHHPHSIW